MFSFAASAPAGKATRPAALAVIMTLLVGLLSLVGFAAPANAAAASLSFTVTAGGEPVDNAQVALFEYVTQNNFSYYDAVDYDGVTNAAGKVTFSGLQTGRKYQANVYYFGQATFGSGVSAEDFAPTYYGATASYEQDAAGYFTPTASTTNKTFSLLDGYTISGELSSPTGDLVVEADGAHYVTAYRVESNELNEDFAGSGSTDGLTAGYAVGSLTPGTYVLYYQPSSSTTWGSVFSGSVTSRGDAETVTIGSSSMPDVDAQFVAGGGTISGTLSLDGGVSLSAISGAYIDAYAHGASRGSTSYGNGPVDPETGAYSISNLPEGQFSLYATVYGNETYFGEYYNDKATAASSNLITLSGAPVTADFAIGTGFTLTGAVRTADSAGVEGIVVTVESADDTLYNNFETTTGPGGNYSIPNIVPGEYNVSFEDPTNEFGTYYPTSVVNVGTKVQSEAATIQSVSQAVSLNLVYPAQSAYTVVVTGPTGAPATNAFVSFDHVVNGVADYSGSVFGTAVAGKPGTYRIGGLVIGETYAPYVGANLAGSYDQYLGGSTLIGDAKTITAQPGSKNSLQFSLAPTVSITGKVTTATGAAAKSVLVTTYLFDGETYTPVNTGQCSSCGVKTSATGAYSAVNLEPGSYKLQFTPIFSDANVGGWFGGNSLETATPIYVGPGKSGVANFTTTTGGSIAGTIKGANTAKKLGFASLTAYRVTDGPTFTAVDEKLSYTLTSPAASVGKFTVPGLPAGEYVIGYEQYPEYPNPKTYADGFIGGATALTATRFTVVAGKATAAGTFLAPETIATGGIQGTITGNLAAGPSDSAYNYVIVQPVDKSQPERWVQLHTTGSYSFGNLPAGEYSVRVDPFNYPTRNFQNYFDTVVVGSSVVTKDITLQAITHLTVSGEVTISGTAKVGGTVDAVANTSNLDSAVSYQWYIDSKKIRGANDSSYTPTATDRGKQLSVRVTHSVSYESGAFFSYAEAVGTTSAAQAVAAPDAPVNLSEPTITPESGILPGTVLRASTGEWDASTAKFSYQWFVDGAPVALATGYTFTVRPVDADEDITVKVTATYAGVPTTAESEPVSSGLLAAPALKTAPVVTATGSTLKVTTGVWSVPGLNYQYAWYVDAAEQEASGASFVYTGTGSVSVRVTAGKVGYASASKTVVAKKGLAPTVNDAPLVSGADGINYNLTDAAKVGDALTVTNGTWIYASDIAPASYTYKWESSINGTTWVTIATAKTATYTPVVADNGKKLRVTVTAVSPEYANGVSVPVVAGTVVLRNELANAFVPSTDLGGYGTVGTVLTAVLPPLSDYPVTGLTFGYAWERSIDGGATYTAIAKATAKTYTVLPADNSARIRAVITATKAGYIPNVVKSSYVTANKQISSVIQPSLTPATYQEVGATVTANPGTFNVAGVTLSYAWYVGTDEDGYELIAGQTAKTLKLTVDYQDKSVGFMVTAAKAGFVSTASDSNAVEVIAAAVDNLTQPVISPAGTQKVGTVLTASPGTWDVATPTLAYQWFYLGETGIVQIPAATSKTLTLTFDLIGKQVGVAVTASKAGFASDTAGANLLVTVAEARINNLTVPTITPNSFAKVGATLTAGTGTWDVVTPTFSYQWLADGSAITGATAKTFKPTVAQQGKTVTVVVTAAKAPFSSVAATSTQSVRVIQAAALPAPTLPSFSFDAPVVGTPLASPSTDVYELFGFSDDSIPATLSYQWYLGTAVIAGATTSSYTPKATDVGKTIKLKVTATSPYYATATYTSPASAPVLLAVAPVATVAPQVSLNGFTPGAKLTVLPGTWNTAGLTFSYSWERASLFGEYVTIPGATAATYTTTTADASQSVRAVVTAKKAGYVTSVVRTLPVSIWVSGALAWNTQPTIGGTTTVGGSLTAVPGVLNIPGATYSYRWLINGNTIPGATAATFVPSAVFVNQAISVEVTASKPGFASVWATSPAVELSLGAAPTVVAGKQGKITGSVVNCTPLTVTAGTWSRGNLLYSYQWFTVRAGETLPIVGATEPTYTPWGPDIGATLKVVVTASSEGFVSGTYTTAPTAVVTMAGCAG